MSSPAEALAEAVATRMRQLSLSQPEAARVSAEHDPAGKGLSERTFTAIVGAERERMHPRTAGILERVLQWPVGSVQRILDGGQPPDPDEFSDPGVTARLAQLEDEVRTLRRLLAALVDDPGARRG